MIHSHEKMFKCDDEVTARKYSTVCTTVDLTQLRKREPGELLTSIDEKQAKNKTMKKEEEEEDVCFSVKYCAFMQGKE